jgi:quercetin dioxygenase-like cupin family protein
MAPVPPQPRIPPRTRFAGSEHIVHLEPAFAALPSESTVHQGHMQKALYRLGRTTIAIFHFETGGRMTPHLVEGEAIIHVLSGRLRVHTSQALHDLSGGSLLLLDPNVPHDVTALEPTRMLLTVVLDGPSTS